MTEKESGKYSRREFIKKSAVIGGSLIVGSGLLSACGLSSKTTSGSVNNAGKGSAGSKKPIKLGLVEPYSGPYALSGTSEKQGAEIAIKKMNDAGGIWGHNVIFVTEDTQTKPNVGANKARKMVTKDNVDILLGDVSSGVGLAVSAYAQSVGIPYIGSGTHSDAITGSAANITCFRSTTSNTMLARATAKFLLAEGKKWYFITADYSWGISGETAFKKELEKVGGTVVGVDRTPLGNSDFSSQLTKAKSSGANVMIMSLYGSDLVNALKQFHQFGLKDTMAVGGPLNGAEIAAGLSDAENIGYWGMPWAPDNGATAAMDFANEVKKTYNVGINWRHWCGYNAAMAAMKGIKRAGTTDAAEVIKALDTLSYDALKKDPVHFRDWDHQLIQEVYVGKAIPKSEWKFDGQYFKIAGRAAGEDVARSKADNKKGADRIASQKVVKRANYTPTTQA